MADLIDREAAIKALSHGEGCGNICSRAIRRIPAVDAVPVKLGKWQEKRHFHSNETSFIEVWQIMSCSKCKRYLITPYQSYLVKYKYCPNCGAYMREGEDNAAD